MRCSACNVTYVTYLGVTTKVHERDCPEAWRDVKGECFECGCEFDRESRWDKVCPDCVQDNLCEFDEEFG